MDRLTDIDACRNSAIGGTWSLKGGQTYEAGVTDLPKISGFSVVANIPISVLEDAEGDCLHKVNLEENEVLKAGQAVVANHKFPFTKIVLGAGSGQVDLVKER